MFHCVILALATQEERRYRLIILRVWNIISSESLCFSTHFLVLDAKDQVQEKCTSSQRYVLIREHH